LPSKAVFLDRDGVLNKNVWYDDSKEWESPRVLADFTFRENVPEALKRLQSEGYLLFIVTNQPSYAKGKTTLAHLHEILQHCIASLHKEGIAIKKTYCSFHHPKSIVPELAAPCPYRKPSPQALLDAIRDYRLDAAQCWMIGDRDTDIECGMAAGVKTIRIAPDYETAGPAQPKAGRNGMKLAMNLAEAVDHICLTASA